MKILLLEDELMLQDAIKEYLEELGHFVDPFNDGLVALEAIKEKMFDLLIFDINVPNLDGLSILETLNTLNINTPTIFTSALVDIDDISRAYDLGCHDYLKKPFHLKELGLRINKVINNHKPQNKHHAVLSKNYTYSIDERCLLFQNVTQELTKKQKQILHLLVQNIDSLVEFDKFREYVWADEPIDNPSIRAEVNRFRKVLKEDFITNIRGLGYKVTRFLQA